MQFPRELIFSGGFLPHESSCVWVSGLIGLQLISESPIALRCFSILFTLRRVTRRHNGISSGAIFLGLGRIKPAPKRQPLNWGALK